MREEQETLCPQQRDNMTPCVAGFGATTRRPSLYSPRYTGRTALRPMDVYWVDRRTQPQVRPRIERRLGQQPLAPWDDSYRGFVTRLSDHDVASRRYPSTQIPHLLRLVRLSLPFAAKWCGR